MASVFYTPWLLLAHFISSAVLLDISQVKVDPKEGSIFGVFQASLPGGYAFNASQAREVCRELGVTIAEKEQVERAQKNGFETCKFGWIDEQIAVVPRITINLACGKGSVGIISWRSELSKKFDVFCFNSTDFEAQSRRTTTQVYKTKNVTHQMSTVEDLPQPTQKTFSLEFNAKPTSTSSSPSMTDPEDKEKPEMLSNKSPSIGAAPIALLIATIFTITLAAAVAVWYFKMSQTCAGLWGQEHQKECIETEVFDNCNGKESKKQKECQMKKEKRTQEEKKKNEVSVTVVPENESGVAA